MDTAARADDSVLIKPPPGSSLAAPAWDLAGELAAEAPGAGLAAAAPAAWSKGEAGSTAAGNGGCALEAYTWCLGGRGLRVVAAAPSSVRIAWGAVLCTNWSRGCSAWLMPALETVAAAAGRAISTSRARGSSPARRSCHALTWP